MKHIIKFIISCLLAPVVIFAAGGGADTLNYIQPDFRQYLKSIERALYSNTYYKSLSTQSLATSDYTSTGDTLYLPISIIDATGNPCRWITTSIGTFTAGTAAASTVTTANRIHEVAIGSSGLLSFKDGSAIATLSITGPYSIGQSFRVTAPSLDFGIIKSGARTYILSFTE